MKSMAYNGWKVGLPEKFWPVTLDNFFDNPDEIRELGLRSLKSVVAALVPEPNYHPVCLNCLCDDGRNTPAVTSAVTCQSSDAAVLLFLYVQ